MLRYSDIVICVSIISMKDLRVSSNVTIQTVGCTIPQFPLIGKSIEKLIQPSPMTQNHCSHNIELVDINATHIWIADDAFDDIGVLKDFYCCYRYFKSEHIIDNVVYGDCIEFNSSIKVNDEFVRVECYNIDSKIYDGYFVFKRKTYPPALPRRNGYNVLIFGMDSVSRLNFHRTMLKTSEYLRLKGSIDFLGYNKLGDNSYPNLLPLLTGYPLSHVKETLIRNNISDVNKYYQFIWDNFKKAGYYTALGSDSLVGLLGIYEYSLSEIPTDYYLQTFMFEARNIFRNKYYNYHQCLNSKYFYKICLDYIESLTECLKSNRLFCIFWEESISHETLNNPSIMDEDYLQLLSTLEDNLYLDETVVIFLSDHGFRWGDIVRSEQGRYEERLPLLQVLLPNDFKRKYKTAYRNLKANRDRLITPFDVYHTLLDIIDPTVLEDDQLDTRLKLKEHLNHLSLFLPIPESRTCEFVGIEEHWCSCVRGKKLKVTNKARDQAAKFLIMHVNKVLHPYPQCFPLAVDKILEATMVKIDDIREYSVVLKTNPGQAVLHGTLIRKKDTWNVSGTVSRLDSYGNIGCIDDVFVRIYCVCQT